MCCEVCGATGELAQCGGCCQVSYCSQRCQRTHWKSHKIVCKPYKVCPAPGKGLGLFATRTIKLGELIMRERPTLIKQGNSPSLLDQFSRLDKAVQEEILQLHHDNKADSLERRINQVFLANACDIVDNTGFALYPTIPRYIIDKVRLGNFTNDQNESLLLSQRGVELH